MAEIQNEFPENWNIDSQGFAMDGSVDLKGKRVLKSKTGKWKACSFIIGYEIFERMAFYGVLFNLVIYLGQNMQEGTVASATNSANWSGTVWITPIIGAYIADSHWGRYRTFIVFSCIYILGMTLLTLSVSLRPLRPPECKPGASPCEKPSPSPLEIGIFFLGLYVIALGAGGTKPNISTIGADQFDEFDPKEKQQKVSFFNWWMFVVLSGLLLAATFVVYIEAHVGYGVAYGIMTTGLIISLVIFLIGTPFYRHKVQKGNPFNRMAQVLVASARKWRVKIPSDPNQLYELDAKEYVAEGRFPISHTPKLSFLDKAATKDASASRWKLCPVTQVEETKIMLRLIPVWVAMFVPGTVYAHATSLFVKQANQLNRHMGPHFEIPAASLIIFLALPMMLTIILYEKVLVRIMRRITGNPRGITMLQRLGIGMVFLVLTMAVASITDMKRISFVKQHRLQTDKNALPLTVFIMVPQCLLAGIAEGFLESGRLEFFYDQVPESMQSIGTALYTTTLGIGSFLASFLISVTSEISGRKGHTSWFLDNLNESRIYYYYSFITILSILNFIYFLVVCRFYDYKRETNQAFGTQKQGLAAAMEI